MKMAWSGLVIGLGTMSAQAIPCSTPSVQGEQQGKFDASGEICFVLPAVLSTLFCLLLRRVGWIHEGDMKLPE